MRETKFITSPSGHKVEIKTYLTGGEQEQIQDVFLSDYEISALNPNDAKLKGSKITEANHKTLEVMVVSVDDKKENILKTLLDLRVEDYKFVLNEINAITQISTEKKSTSKI